MDLKNPDTFITAADLESLALEYLKLLPISGVEGRTLDPDDGWATVLHAAVEQTSIHDICDQTTDIPCSDRVLEWLATVDHDEFEIALNDLLSRQARQMLLKATPRSICLDFVDIHYHGRYHLTKTELCTTKPRDGTGTCHRYCAAFVLCRNKPLIRRGEKLAELLETKVSHWSEYAMYEGTAREVRFPLAICVSYHL